MDNKLIFISMVHGLTINFVIGNLTINEVENILILYFEKESDI